MSSWFLSKHEYRENLCTVWRLFNTPIHILSRNHRYGNVSLKYYHLHCLSIWPVLPNLFEIFRPRKFQVYYFSYGKKHRNQNILNIRPLFGHFWENSAKILRRFVRPLTFLLGPFWIMWLKNRPVGNTDYDVPLPGLLELMVGVHVVLPDGGQLSLDGKGRLLHLRAIHLTLHQRDWKSGKEHVVFALPIFYHLGKLPRSSERPPMYSVTAGRHWKVGECSRRVTATSYLV